MRKLGEILLDLEVIIDEMITDHDIQKGDVLALVNTHIDIHHPDAIEVYIEDDSSPEFYYGVKK